MDLHVAKLRNCMRLWMIFHKVDVPAGTSWPLLARCPACGSILASDHLPSNPLVFAFWVVANGRFDWGKVIGTVIQCSYPYKTMWPYPFSRPVPSPRPIQCWNSGKILDTCVQTCLWGWWGEEMGMRFLRSLVLDFAQTSALFVGRDVCRMRVNWPHSVSVSSIAPIEQWKTFALLASYIIISCRLQMESVIVLCH